MFRARNLAGSGEVPTFSGGCLGARVGPLYLTRFPLSHMLVPSKCHNSRCLHHIVSKTQCEGFGVWLCMHSCVFETGSCCVALSRLEFPI